MVLFTLCCHRGLMTSGINLWLYRSEKRKNSAFVSSLSLFLYKVKGEEVGHSDEIFCSDVSVFKNSLCI